MTVLSVDNLVKQYSGRKVVNDVSLTVDSGTVVGLLGPNGAGKTTTFYLVVGMVKPDKGHVLIGSENLTADPMHIRARKGILEMLPIDRNERQARSEMLLEELGIAHLAAQRASVLSGGEKRRLEISRTLAIDPAFILLDEPFAGVDPLAVIDIKNIIGHLKQRGIGVLISDHNVRETLEVCDRAYILNEGQVIEAGSPEEIIASKTARRIYLGDEFRL